jgi:signal transduction histidine kinase
MSVVRKVIPSELFLLHQWFVVEESLSLIRHDLRNRLGSIRNANFYLRRRVQKLAPDVSTADPRVPEFFALIASELEATEQIMQSRLPPPDGGELIAASAIVQRVRELVELPGNVQAIVETADDARIRIAPDEAALAMYCLVENAVDALAGADGTIRLRTIERDGRLALEVEDDARGGVAERALEAFFTTRRGRMGIGVNIARRIAARWSGTLALTTLEHGACATLRFGIEGR